jgi:hypothetical protein
MPPRATRTDDQPRTLARARIAGIGEVLFEFRPTGRAVKDSL